jgi:hypothetical protein
MLRLCLCALLVCVGCSGRKINESSASVPKEQDTVAVQATEEVIEPPDSVYRLKTRIPGVFILQSFYPDVFRLETVRKTDGREEPIDSLFGYPDSFVPSEKIVYDPANDWYTYLSVGTGTGHFSKHRCIVGVTKGGFRELFSWEEYISDIDVEGDPTHCQSIENTVLEMSPKRIRLLSKYEDGVIGKGDRVRPTRTLTDTATFLSDPATGVFSWHRSSNPDFVRFWREWWYPE